MQGFLATITTAFTPQVLFAMLGGFIGALISSDRKRYGLQLSLLFIVVAIFASAGMADYLHTDKKIASIWLMFILNEIDCIDVSEYIFISVENVTA